MGRVRFAPVDLHCDSMRTRAYAVYLLVWLTLFVCHPLRAGGTWEEDGNPLAMPNVGATQLRILSPTLLELSLISTKRPDPAPVERWNLVQTDGQLRLPAASELIVSVADSTVAVQSIGFKRRPLYAPLKQRDLRIGNWLYLRLATPIANGQTVEVKNPAGTLWPPNARFSAKAEPLRHSPVIHVNQVGYLPTSPKKAMVGYYLGSLGELDIATDAGFKLLDSHSHKEVYQARLVQRADRGFTFPCYQKVLEADFSNFTEPGEYRLLVPGLGASFPFFIDDGIAAAFVRAYALGLYHQRCGTSNALPFTRFTHDACHIGAAAVPSAQFANTQKFMAEESANFKSNPRHTAPQLKSFDSSLYPFVQQGRIDVAGGHHDAGDYSKYTLNSAALVHFLVFAVDAFSGVGELDNLGLPESGDGKSDLLQEAKWEADFLAKMQDTDGGFYFLVYPRDRRYENNVLPERGDPQLVWPKTTAATAAAVAALAQCGSSPRFRKQFPQAAALYLEKAHKGWSFLANAIARHGKDGAYQKITHYGHEYLHDDELAWAACEMYLATGDSSYQRKLLEWFPNPADPATRKWSWWRLYESYGCAIRSYTFAARTGRLKREQLDRLYLGRCEAEIIAAAEDQLRSAQESAYGTSFPVATKRVRGAGWYFSMDQSFDLAVASQLEHPPLNDPRPKYFEAILSNLNYESGCNPVNTCYLTGLGWKRQREIVHHFAQNDRRVLPPSGIPLGNIQGGFGWLDHYKGELGALIFPSDGAQSVPYPFYDRWGDSFNLQTEFVAVNQARGLATVAWLMAQTPLKNQPWKSATANITGLSSATARHRSVTATLTIPGLALDNARIVWEARDREPVFGSTFTFSPTNAGPHWVEAEAQWPDGRRVYAVTNFTVSSLPAVAIPAPNSEKPQRR
jgi:hypothetical protein